MHPGGAFFKHKQQGWWSIPKGLSKAGEGLEDAAVRELQEETGIRTKDKLSPFGTVKANRRQSCSCLGSKTSGQN